MEEIVSVHVAKTHLSRLLARVEAGDVITIARGRTPVAKLMPIAPKPGREFGAMRGEISSGPEFFDPLPRGPSLTAGVNRPLTPALSPRAGRGKKMFKG